MAELVPSYDDLDREIYRLRLSLGYTWRKVGDAVGLSHEQARERYHKRNRDFARPDLEDYRNEENDRLDDLTEKLYIVLRSCFHDAIEVDGETIIGSDYIEMALKTIGRIESVRRASHGLNGAIAIPAPPTPLDEQRQKLEAMLSGYLAAQDDKPTKEVDNDTTTTPRSLS